MEQFNNIEIIGKGSYGTIWKVKDTITKKLYVIKKVKKDVKYNMRIRNEIKIMSEVNHKNLISLIGYKEDQYFFNIIMDYEEDVIDLTQYITKYKYDNKIVKYIFAQLIDGINYLHNKNIVHNDIRPKNILINTKTKDIKLIDFVISSNINGGKIMEYIEMIDFNMHIDKFFHNSNVSNDNNDSHHFMKRDILKSFDVYTFSNTMNSYSYFINIIKKENLDIIKGITLIIQIINI